MTVNRTADWKPIRVKLSQKKVNTEQIKLGAFIGDNVVVGAGNTIEPGTVVGPEETIPARYTVSRK